MTKAQDIINLTNTTVDEQITVVKPFYKMTTMATPSKLQVKILGGLVLAMKAGYELEEIQSSLTAVKNDPDMSQESSTYRMFAEIEEAGWSKFRPMGEVFLKDNILTMISSVVDRLMGSEK